MTPSGARARAGSNARNAPAGTYAQASPLRAAPPAEALEAVYARLLEAHGSQQWWPSAALDGQERRLEICLGAILTQNTAWKSAASALENLRGAGALSCEALLALPFDVVADLVRPSGHFNVKARKLREFARVVVEEHGGDLDALLAGDAEEVRSRLLAIWGIGPETADAMTLYAAGKPTFVVDAYTYRLFERLDLAPGPRRYEVYRDTLLEAIGRDIERLNEWHALVVRHGQQFCRRTAPHCDECTLLDRCPTGQANLGLTGGPAPEALEDAS